MFAALFLLCLYLFETTAESKLYIYIKAVLIWTLVMLFGLEFLSLFHAVTPFYCFIFWGTIDILLLILFFIKIKKISSKTQKIKELIKSSIHLKMMTPWSVILAFTSCVTLYLALRFVPNNYDSMTYRLPRIMHWFQNRTVAHYASNSVRQVTSPPLADFVNLYVYSMTGRRDVLFNIMQWSAYITNTALVMGISHKLNCRRGTCIASGFFFMTTPIVLAESMTTQNDNLAALYLLFFVYILLDFYTCNQLVFKKVYIEKTFMLSLCIAFAYLTKPSVMFGIVVFAFGLLIICIKRKDSIVALLKLLSISVISILVILFPEVYRNICTFHAISAPIAGAQQLVGTLNPKYLLVNFLKNFTFNSPNIYFNNITAWIQNGIYKFSDFLGVNINDPSISENGFEFEMYGPRRFGHDTAVNPILFYSLIFCILLLIFFYKKIKLKRNQLIYCVLSIASFCMLCIFLRWERFVTRYMIAYLALLCPAILIVVSNFCSTVKTKYYYAFLSILIFTSSIELFNMIPYHFKESKRNADTHDVEYFHNHGEECYYVFDDIVHYFYDNHYKNIGLLTNEVSFEYPLWAMLLDEDITIKHITVNNSTSIYESPEFIPDCIFVNGRYPEEVFSYHDVEYHKSEIGDDNFYLYIK